MQGITNDKSYKIQILKGLSILAVVFIHCTPSGIAQVWCRPFFNYSVGMFLFISGLLSDAKRWNPRKRIMKVTIPYVIWTLIYVILHNSKNFANIPIQYIKCLITARAAGMMYYIFVYCEFALLIPLIDKLARSIYRWIGFVITPVEIVFLRMIPILTGKELNNHISLFISVSCLGWFIYFYFGYLLGNKLLEIKMTESLLFLIWTLSIVLQIAEGYLLFLRGVQNCGTQLKLSAILSGILFCFLFYKYLVAKNAPKSRLLYYLGDNSFGIFFSHLAIMFLLSHLPYYRQVIVFPLDAIIAASISFLFTLLGRRLLGNYAKYLAL